MTEASPVALLLEDEPLLAMVLEASLHDLDFRVVTLTTCEKAEAWLAVLSPAVAVIDVHLSDGASQDIAAYLSRLNVPFVVYSGAAPGDYAGTPLAQGVWLPKPSDPDEVAAAAAALVPSVLKGISTDKADQSRAP